MLLRSKKKLVNEYPISSFLQDRTWLSPFTFDSWEEKIQMPHWIPGRFESGDLVNLETFVDKICQTIDKKKRDQPPFFIRKVGTQDLHLNEDRIKHILCSSTEKKSNEKKRLKWLDSVESTESTLPNVDSSSRLTIAEEEAHL